MRRRTFLQSAAAAPLLVSAAAGSRAATAAEPRYWSLAPTPPMGWNSYDVYGGSVTEDQYLANAAVMQRRLLPHGYRYAIIDYLWYDSTLVPPGTPRGATTMEVDAFGRALPAPNRFPSAADGKGFGPLAKRIHAMGLKFGFHIMRGIPRLAVEKNLPIQGSHFRARDAADTHDMCSWDKHMYGVKGNTAAGQAYYDSLARLYTSWGTTFLKIDDLSNPYHIHEIHAIRRALNRFGPSIVLSTSPGPTPVGQARDISHHANMWRISGDFWDSWGAVNNMFNLVHAWHGYAAPGHWPDCDMICLGRIGDESVGGRRRTHFTMDEQRTLMTLWCLAPSPLMLGMKLTALDPWTQSLLCNPLALAINQDPLGAQAQRVAAKGPAEVWVKNLHNGSKAVGLFNRGESDYVTVTARWSDLHLKGPHTVRNVWTGRSLGKKTDHLAMQVPSHGCRMLVAAAS